MILSLMLAELLVWSGFFYAFIAMPLDIAASTGWSLSQIMGAYSLSLLCLALFTPLAGQLIDRGWASISLPLGALSGAVALALVATEPSLPVFYLLWAFIGVAMGFTLYEPVFGLLLRSLGDGARPAITAISIFAGLASLVTFPAMYLLKTSFGWPMAFMVFAALIIGIAVPCFRFSATRLNIRAEPAIDQPHALSIRMFFRDRGFRALALIFVLPALASGMIISQILPVLNAIGISVAIATTAAACIGPMQIVARIAVQALPRTFISRNIVLTALACLTASAIALSFAGHAVTALLFFVLSFGVGNGLVGVYRPLVVRDRLGQTNIAAKTGAIAMPALLAVAIAPVLGARVLETADLSAFLMIAGACPLLSFMVLAALPSRDLPE